MADFTEATHALRREAATLGWIPRVVRDLNNATAVLRALEDIAPEEWAEAVYRIGMFVGGPTAKFRALRDAVEGKR